MNDIARDSTVELLPGLLTMPPGLGEHRQEDCVALAGLLRVLFARWDALGLKWLVLRNAAALPDYTRYDVDVLVQPEHVRQMLSIAADVAREKGWRVTGRIAKRFYTCLMLQRRSENGAVQFLPLDIFAALEYRGYAYLDVMAALAARIRTDKGVWTVPPAWDAAITLLKEWLPHGRLKENSRDSVLAAAQVDAKTFEQLLASAVGTACGPQLAEAAMQGAWERLPAIARPRGNMLWRCVSWLQAAWANVRHLVRPSLGVVVCLAGADGSGKSTLAQGLAEMLYKRPFKGIYYVHGNVGVLPRFRDMRAWFTRTILQRELARAPEADHLKGMMDPIPAWKSMILATYYALDLWLARPLLRRLRGQWMLVIMDRSFYDYYYQLGHRNCPAWYLDWLTRLIPRPDALLCLHDDPVAIHQRKPELTVAEIEREQTVLRVLMAKAPFASAIDGRAGVDAAVARACRQVWGIALGVRSS